MGTGGRPDLRFPPLAYLPRQSLCEYLQGISKLWLGGGGRHFHWKKASGVALATETTPVEKTGPIVHPAQGEAGNIKVITLRGLRVAEAMLGEKAR